MVLISENEYNKIRLFDDTIENQNLPPDRAQKLEVSKMFEEKLIHDAPKTLIRNERLSSEIINKSISKFPINRRSLALKLFQTIDQTPEYSWDEKGQLIVNSEVIPSSNIIDILYFGKNTEIQ